MASHSNSTALYCYAHTVAHTFGRTMTIRTVHQVINKAGTVIGEFMDIKLAKDLDNRTLMSFTS